MFKFLWNSLAKVGVFSAEQHNKKKKIISISRCLKMFLEGLVARPRLYPCFIFFFSFLAVFKMLHFFSTSFYTLFIKESHIPSVSCTEKALCFVIICPICCTIFVILPVFKTSLFITKSSPIFSLLDFFTSSTISVSSVLLFLFINNWQAHSVCGAPVLQTFTAKDFGRIHVEILDAEIEQFFLTAAMSFCSCLTSTQVFPLRNLFWNSCFLTCWCKTDARVLLGPLLKWPVRFAV